jgi:hypothetical protein
MKNFSLSFALIALALQTAALAGSNPMSTRLQGSVVSTTASSITVETSHGNQTAAFGPNLRVVDLSKSSLDKVQNNSFIGTTVVPQPDGPISRRKFISLPNPCAAWAKALRK